MAKRIELKGERRVTSLLAGFRRPAWSSAGRLALETDGKLPALYLLDSKGRLEGRLVEGSEPTWSPDGQRLAFTRLGDDGRSQIWVCNAATPDAARRLAGGDGAVWEHPAWGPEGHGIACASDWSNPGGLRHIWHLDAEHGDRRRLTCDPQRSDGHPAWAPDGTAIAFDGDDRADDAREIDVYTMDLRTGALSCLSDGTVPTRRPAFVGRRHLLAERRSFAGPTLVVLDRAKKRTLPVGEQPGGEREPAVRVGRKATLVTFVRRDDKSGRDAVWVAELRGVKIDVEGQSAPTDAADEAVDRVGLPVLGAGALAPRPPAPSGDPTDEDPSDDHAGARSERGEAHDEAFDGPVTEIDYEDDEL